MKWTMELGRLVNLKLSFGYLNFFVLLCNTTLRRNTYCMFSTVYAIVWIIHLTLIRQDNSYHMIHRYTYTSSHKLIPTELYSHRNHGYHMLNMYEILLLLTRYYAKTNQVTRFCCYLSSLYHTVEPWRYC